MPWVLARTERVLVGTWVLTPTVRYNPAVMAQTFATMACLAPGRVMLGVGTAQAALAYGADDLDGTVRHELIYHDAGATTPEALSVDEIRRLIVAAGRDPVERDTLYRPVVRDVAIPSRWTIDSAATCAAS